MKIARIPGCRSGSLSRNSQRDERETFEILAQCFVMLNPEIFSEIFTNYIDVSVSIFQLLCS